MNVRGYSWNINKSDNIDVGESQVGYILISVYVFSLLIVQFSSFYTHLQFLCSLIKIAITIKLFVSVLCIHTISSVENRRIRVNTKTLNYSNLNLILIALKETGLSQRPNNVNTTTRQYTCTTVLAEEEVNNIKWLSNSQFPTNFTENNRRIQVQYNENDNADHGEKIVLRRHMNRLITEMQFYSRKKGYNMYPIVVMFSTNIPCSLTGHECARLLMEHKQERLGTNTEYTMIVGFTTFFGFSSRQTQTNKEASFNSLNDGQIDVYYMLRESFDNGQQFGSLVLTDVHINQPSANGNFQFFLFGCLMAQPLVYCCTSALDQIDFEQVKRIVSFSINSMIYTCRSKLGINQNIIIKSNTCFKSWIEDNIGGDCVRCGGGTVGMWESKFFIRQCIKQAADLKLFVAALPDPRQLDYPFWTSGSLQWNDTPDNFRKNSALYCYNRQLHPGSFCTKIDKGTTSQESSLLNPEF